MKNDLMVLRITLPCFDGSTYVCPFFDSIILYKERIDVSKEAQNPTFSDGKPLIT